MLAARLVAMRRTRADAEQNAPGKASSSNVQVVCGQPGSPPRGDRDTTPPREAKRQRPGGDRTEEPIGILSPVVGVGRYVEIRRSSSLQGKAYETSCNLLQPLASKSGGTSAYWTQVIRDALAIRIDRAVALGLLRPLCLDSGCTSLGTCILSIKGMGVPLSPDIWIAERIDNCRRHIVRNIPEVEHAWKSLKDMGQGSGYCTKLYRPVPPAPQRRRAQRDVLIIGSPCQPFTAARDHGKDAEGGCESHPLYECTFGPGRAGVNEPGDSVVEIAQETRPHVLVVENVKMFVLPDPMTGIAPIDTLTAALRVIKTCSGDSLCLVFFYNYPVSFHLGLSYECNSPARVKCNSRSHRPTFPI